MTLHLVTPGKVPRPQVEKGVTDDDWNSFLDRFAHYKRVYSLKGVEVNDQLLALLMKTYGGICTRSMSTGQVTSII